MQDGSPKSVLLIDFDAGPGENRRSVDEQLAHSDESLLVNLRQFDLLFRALLGAIELLFFRVRLYLIGRLGQITVLKFDYFLIILNFKRFFFDS